MINMDETSLYSDMTSSTANEDTGSKDVLIKTTGYGKMRLAVVLSVTASGKHLPAIQIFKNLNDIPKLKNRQ